MKRGIFCHTQFKKMLLSAVMIQFVIALSDIMDRIIAAQLFWLGMMLVLMITCVLFIIFLRIRHIFSLKKDSGSF